MKDNFKEMNIKLTLIILFFSINIFSQDNLELPNSTPPSPEAYALTKYGDIPVNEFTGMINTTIPLYNYKAGHLELPISMNYSGAGVKVDELCTWTGIKWTLNAGGVITRTVNDVPDEQAITRFFKEDLNAMYLVDGGSDVETLSMIFGTSTSTQYDTKVDIFNFSFPGYSGSFYLDKNKIPRITKKDTELKIEIGGTGPNPNLYLTKEFVITTPEGIKYYFGGNEVEETHITYGHHQSITNLAPTAYYLYMIEHPVSGFIYLEYETIDNYITILSKSYEINRLSLEECDWQDNFIPVFCHDPNNYDPEAGADNNPIVSPVPNGSTTTPSETKLEVSHGKYLKKIFSNFNTTTVNFNSSAPTGSNNHYKRILDDIIVLNGTTEINKIKFDYDITNQRFFLKELRFQDSYSGSNNQAGRVNEVYKMEYDGGLPARFSTSQDHLGYYNGAMNPGTLLPINDSAEFSSLVAGQSLANRNVNFNYAKRGTLTKLFYPTGGHTKFEYEPHMEKEYDRKGAVLQIFRNNYENNIDKLISTYAIGFLYVDEDNITIENGPTYFNQNLKINVYFEALGQTYNNEKVYVKLIDVTDIQNPIIVSTKYTLMVPIANSQNQSGVFSMNKVFDFNILNGKKYKIEFYFDATYSGSSVPMMARATFSFIDGIKAVAGPGIRIKSISDYTDNNANPTNVKRYYYTTAANLTRSPFEYLDFTRSYNYIDHYTFSSRCEIVGPAGETVSIRPKLWHYKRLKSSTNELNESIDRVYKNVVVSVGGDNFEKGGVQKTFEFTRNSGLEVFKDVTIPGMETYNGHIHGNYYTSDTITYAGNAKDVINGTLTKEFNIIKKDGSLFKVSQKKIDYSYSLNNIINGCLTGGQPFEDWFHFNKGYASYQLAEYSYLSQSLQLNSTITKEYIDPVPIPVPGSYLPPIGGWYPTGDVDGDGIINAQDNEYTIPNEDVLEQAYNKITTTETFHYGTLKGLPTEIISTTSDLNRTRVVKNYYANDGINFLGLNTGQIAAYQKLVSQNRISTPVDVEIYDDKTLLSKQRTLFFIGNNPNQVLAEVIKASKGDHDLENRVEFTEYDGYGNIRDVMLSNGSKTRYYYNSNNQVTVKIENYLPPSSSGTGSELPENEPVNNVSDPCSLRLQYPDSMVTVYSYSTTTNQIIKITDTNCKETHYIYDNLHRLIKILDNEGNLLKEFSTNFRRY